MTIGFRSNLVVSFEKMTISGVSIVSLCVFQWYKRKSCRNANIEGYFHFSSKWSLFSKILVSSGDIKFFLKKYSLFLKNVSFWWRCFSLVKNFILCKKC